MAKMGRPCVVNEKFAQEQGLKEDEWYSINDLVEMTHISRRTFERLLKSGEIKGIKVGRQWRIRKKDFTKR